MTCSCIPIEITENIIQCNMYDPATLLCCALVSKDWYTFTRRHLERKTTLSIKDKDQLLLLSSLLASCSSKRLFEKVQLLRVIDNPSQPFAHNLSFLISGTSLPNLTTITLEDVNWTTLARPHNDFFKWLLTFSTVTSLCIHHCCLHVTAHVLRLLRGLPKLKQSYHSRSSSTYFRSKGAVQLQHVLIGEDTEPHRHAHLSEELQTLQEGERSSCWGLFHPVLTCWCSADIASYTSSLPCADSTRTALARYEWEGRVVSTLVQR